MPDKVNKTYQLAIPDTLILYIQNCHNRIFVVVYIYNCHMIGDGRQVINGTYMGNGGWVIGDGWHERVHG